MTRTKSLKAKYDEEVKAALKEKFGYKNVLVKLLTTQKSLTLSKLN